MNLTMIHEILEHARGRSNDTAFADLVLQQHCARGRETTGNGAFSDSGSSPLISPWALGLVSRRVVV